VIKQSLKGLNSTYKICEQNFNKDCATLFIYMTPLLLFIRRKEAFETDRVSLYENFINFNL